MNDILYIKLLDKITEDISDKKPIRLDNNTKDKFIMICKKLKGNKSLKQAQLKSIYKLIVFDDSFNSTANKDLIIKNLIDILYKYVVAINTKDIEIYNIKIKLLNDFNNIVEVDDYIESINNKISNNPDSLEDLTFLYEDRNYKIFLADDEDLFRKVFEDETNWCVVNQDDYWNDYANKGILVLFEDKDIRYQDKNETPYKFVLATLIENKDNNVSFEIIKDLRDKDVSLDIGNKIKSYTNIVINSLKKEFGFVDDNGKDKTIDGIRNQIYFGKYITKIKLSNEIYVEEDIFGSIYYNKEDKILEFYDDDVEINNSNYQYLRIIMEKIKVNKIWLRGERTVLKSLNKSIIPDIALSYESALFINNCENLELKITYINNDQNKSVMIGKSKNINISGIKIDDMDIYNSQEIIIDNEVGVIFNIKDSADINFTDGVASIREIENVNDLSINNSLTNLRIMRIVGELNGFYLSNRSNIDIKENDMDKIININFDDEDDDEIDNRFIRNESIDDEFINEVVKKGLSLLLKVKKV